VSYLDSPRVHFNGWFQADVSTINNDVRFYQNASFVPDYQKLNQNGSWNPEGTGVYRLLDCEVTGGYLNGSAVCTTGADAVVGMTIQNAADRAPGKLVDLDPQQQMVSEIWGMQLRIVDGAGQTLMRGEFHPAAFMNLWQRQQQGVRRDQLLAAYYQSVLEEVTWFDLAASPLLQTLRSQSCDGKLSIAFNVYGYGRDSTIPRYTMGHITGTLGPYRKGEPKHFTVGRQMIAGGPFTQPAGGVGTMQAKVADDGMSITADFGNSFQIPTADGGLVNIGQVFLGVLKTNPPAIQTTVDSTQVVLIGEVGYQTAGWYTQTAGVQTFDLQSNTDAQQFLPTNPIVLLTPVQGSSTYTVLLQESINGLYVRSDRFVFRLEPGEQETMEFYASQFGKPLAQSQVQLSATQGFMGGSGGGPTIAPAPNPPAAIPSIGTPADGVTYAATAVTDANGYAAVALKASADGPGTPRGYIESQLYGVGYQLATQPSGYVINPMNYVSVLAFTKKDVPEYPTWYADIQALLTQFGNLYPIMGRYVVNLSDYDDVVRRRQILILAFSLPRADANHMPVTRDMGEGDRKTILKWLSMRGPDGLPPKGIPPVTLAAPAPALVDQLATASEVPLPPEQAAGKTGVIVQYEQRQLAAQRKGEQK